MFISVFSFKMRGLEYSFSGRLLLQIDAAYSKGSFFWPYLFKVNIFEKILSLFFIPLRKAAAQRSKRTSTSGCLASCRKDWTKAELDCQFARGLNWWP